MFSGIEWIAFLTGVRAGWTIAGRRLGNTGEKTATVDQNGVVALFTAILTDTPRLPGASCTGKRRVYDQVEGCGHQHHRQERARLAKVTQVCAGCPVIHRCADVTTTAEEAA